MIEIKHNVIVNKDHLLIMIQIPCPMERLLDSDILPRMRDAVKEGVELIGQNAEGVLG